MTGRCEECDAPIPAEEWHPVVTERDDGGEVRLRDFCSEACLAAWETDD